MKQLPWRLVHPYVVYGHIAATLSGAPSTKEPLQLGKIALREHQHDAALRISRAIALHGGALLADSVGLGKTYVALAVARAYEHAHIIVPATLVSLWRRALAETGYEHATLHSLQSLSRRPLPRCTHSSRCLIIVDEAHHLRTQNTIRYGNAAAYTANRDVLLLSATPIHNRLRDLQNILGLFLGTRVDVMDDSSLASCIVRRTGADTLARERAIPIVQEHPPLQLADNPLILETLLRLPPPLPTRDGGAAGALIRLGLLQAWCSSDAALSDTLRRRQLRGEAMLHSLTSGHHPTQRELQSWILGNDSIQLGFAELLVANAAGDSSALIKTLSVHLESLHHLLQVHTRSAHSDPQRAAILRGLLATPASPSDLYSQSPLPGDVPIIAFSHFASTVSALHRALRDIAGVASLTSRGGNIASGRISRQELITTFAPIANGRPPPASHQRIRLLLTTDMLAEGVNLQDAGAVVHLDLPWTDAARAQRVGRLARMGSPHETVHVFTFAPPAGVEKTLQIMEALKRKAQIVTAAIGRDVMTLPSSAARGLSAPEIATHLHSVMQHWSRLSQAEAISEHEDRDCGAREDKPDVENILHGGVETASYERDLSTVLPHSDAPVEPGSMVVACVRSSEAGWIAALSLNGQPHVLTRIGTLTAETSAGLVDAVHSIVDSTSVHGVAQDHIMSALHDMQQWAIDQALHEITGPSVRAMSSSHQRALQTIANCIASIGAADRHKVARPAINAERIVMASRGAGAEHALAEWCVMARQLDPVQWLAAISGFTALSPPRAAQVAGAPGGAVLRVHALLLLSPVNIQP